MKTLITIAFMLLATLKSNGQTPYQKILSDLRETAIFGSGNCGCGLKPVTHVHKLGKPLKDLPSTGDVGSIKPSQIEFHTSVWDSDNMTAYLRSGSDTLEIPHPIIYNTHDTIRRISKLLQRDNDKSGEI